MHKALRRDGKKKSYQEKDPPLWKNFNICEISDKAKLVESNSSTAEAKNLHANWEFFQP